MDRIDTYYVWTVRLDGHEPVKTIAKDKLQAVQQAARKWGIPWTQIARKCGVSKGKLHHQITVVDSTGGENGME